MQLGLTIKLIFTLSILIAGIIAILRFSQITHVCRPFIYLIWLSCFTELLSVYLVISNHHNIVLYTIYSLFESLLLLWFFRRLGVLNKNRVFYFVLALFVVVWFIESFLMQQFGSYFTFYFNMLYGFTVVLLSIRAINSVLFSERELLKSPVFIICTGLLIFFTYDTINRTFRLYGLHESVSFRQSVEDVQMIVNLLSNLIFAWAVLSMRKKQPLTFRF